MKKFIGLFLSILAFMSLASCNKKSSNTEEIYENICTLTDGYTADDISYTSILTSSEMNIVLTNTGALTKKDDVYTYTYTYQYLNKIGSGAEALISTKSGSVSGTLNEIMTEGFSLEGDVKVVSLNLKDSFKTHKITDNGDSYLMSGYITRNTIIKNTENLDDDIRFNYELIVNKDITEIKSLVISYVTVRFDSVVITITF